MNKMEREENLVAAFKYFDKDGSGYITIDELEQACKEFGLADGQLAETIKEIDLDNVGTNPPPSRGQVKKIVLCLVRFLLINFYIR